MPQAISGHHRCRAQANDMEAIWNHILSQSKHSHKHYHKGREIPWNPPPKATVEMSEVLGRLFFNVTGFQAGSRQPRWDNIGTGSTAPTLGLGAWEASGALIRRHSWCSKVGVISSLLMLCSDKSLFALNCSNLDTGPDWILGILGILRFYCQFLSEETYDFWFVGSQVVTRPALITWSEHVWAMTLGSEVLLSVSTFYCIQRIQMGLKIREADRPGKWGIFFSNDGKLKLCFFQCHPHVYDQLGQGNCPGAQHLQGIPCWILNHHDFSALAQPGSFTHRFRGAGLSEGCHAALSTVQRSATQRSLPCSSCNKTLEATASAVILWHWQQLAMNNQTYIHIYPLGSVTNQLPSVWELAMQHLVHWHLMALPSTPKSYHIISYHIIWRSKLFQCFVQQKRLLNELRVRLRLHPVSPLCPMSPLWHQMFRASAEARTLFPPCLLKSSIWAKFLRLAISLSEKIW